MSEESGIINLAQHKMGCGINSKPAEETNLEANSIEGRSLPPCHSDSSELRRGSSLGLQNERTPLEQPCK